MGKQWKQSDFIFLGSKITTDGDCSHEIKRRLILGRKVMIRWTWVWVNSGSWWWPGRPGMLWFMGLQRVGHDWATDLICGSAGKKSACSVGGLGSISMLGRSTGEGNGSPLQYSCLENSMDRGAGQAAVHGITKCGHDCAPNFHFHVSPLTANLTQWFYFWIAETLSHHNLPSLCRLELGLIFSFAWKWWEFLILQNHFILSCLSFVHE